MITHVCCIGDLSICRNFMSINEIDVICTVYPVFVSLCKAATFVAQTSGQCFLIRTIDETFNSFSCVDRPEDVMNLMLRHMVCCQVVCSKLLEFCAMSSRCTT